MNVITATEFRNNQRKYLDLAEREPVYVTRAGKTPIALTPVSLDESFSTEEIEEIKQSLQQIREGKYTIIEDPTNLWESI